MNKCMRYMLCSILGFSIMHSASGANRIGRMGLGMTSQLKNNLPALSFKLQKSQSFALGILGGFSTSDNGGHGVGIKAYRNLFDEPYLNFYLAGMAAYLNQKSSSSDDTTGFQLDLTMGSEFSFSELQSIGLSFEFGISVNNLNDFVFESVGHHFLVAGVHFYL